MTICREIVRKQFNVPYTELEPPSNFIKLVKFLDCKDDAIAIILNFLNGNFRGISTTAISLIESAIRDLLLSKGIQPFKIINDEEKAFSLKEGLQACKANQFLDNKLLYNLEYIFTDKGLNYRDEACHYLGIKDISLKIYSSWLVIKLLITINKQLYPIS